MRIRPARPQEAGALTALAFAAKAHWGYPPEVMEGWRDDLRIEPDQLCEHAALACLDGELPDGFYTLRFVDGRCELDNLWVHPARMGGGIGRALLQHALEAARAAGAERVLVDADPYAEAFYLACGALRTGEVAAPIPGELGRVRPQLEFPLSISRVRL